MAPIRKSKSVYKRFTSEASPETKTKQRKKKLADKLGPQWTKGELVRFYDAYRKHQRDWKKVATAVRNSRSVDMVEALFYMNQAYLSLPEGTASVAGLIAMMTDHYSVLGTESEGEDNDAFGVPRKHKKRKRAKVPSGDFQLVFPPFASTEGCLSFLKLTPAYGIRRRAAGKRTPRFPLPSTYSRDDREVTTPPRAKKQRSDDDAHVVASRAKESQSKYRNNSNFENGVRISQDRRRIKGVSDRDCALLMEMEGVGTVGVEEAKGNDSDDSREVYSVNGGIRTKPQKAMVYFEGSTDEFEALCALDAMSGSLPLAGLMESELSAQLKEERIANNVNEKYNTLETACTSHHREKSRKARPDDSLLHSISATENRKLKSAQETVDRNAVFIRELGISRRKRKPKESAEDDNLMILVKERRAGQGSAKQLKIAKTSEDSKTGPDAVVSATQVSSLGPASLPPKLPNRRKISLKKSLQQRAKSHDKPHDCKNISEHELLQKKVSTCLSYPLVRRWCKFEWFYSAIDYPWFAKLEFLDYLNHVGFSHVPRLTRLEWSVFKSSLGRARRFSSSFVQEERDKLKQYRETVRKHYTELRTGAREGLPTDLARPLSVGNRVIAIHPKTHEICDGKILTVDHDKCNVLFDELGVELVTDIDCMPLNPLEYMPESLRRRMDKCRLSISKGRHPNADASIMFAPCVLENVNFSMNTPMKQDDDDIKGSILHGKVLTTNNARGTKIQKALMMQRSSDVQEMEPELIEIFNGSKSRAQAMVEEAMKAASSVKKAEDVMNMVQVALSSNGKHQPLDNSIVPGTMQQGHTNGSLDHHQSQSHSDTAEPMTNGFISQDEMQMPSELIASCVATCLMIQKCTEKQYPPAEVAKLMEKVVRSMQPRCPQNMAIYREVQTCMGWIKNQIMSVVRT